MRRIYLIGGAVGLLLGYGLLSPAAMQMSHLVHRGQDMHSLGIAEVFLPKLWQWWTFYAALGGLIGLSIAAIYGKIIEHKSEINRTRESLKQIFNSVTDGIISIDRSFVITSVNRAYCDMMDESCDDILGRHCYEISHRADSPCIGTEHECFLREVFESGKPYSSVHIHYDKRGREIFSKVTWYPVFNRAGGVVEVLETIEDVTEKRMAENKLQWELSVNRAIADLSNVLIDPCSSIDEIAALVLDEARELTASRHGYVGFIDPVTRNLVSLTLTSMMDTCRVRQEERSVKFPVGGDGRYPGLWGHSINTAEGFYTNSPAAHEASVRMPEGHVPLVNFLSVPAVFDGQVIGQISLANKEGGYEDLDLEAVRLIADLYALLLNRKRVDESLKTSVREKEVLLKEVHHRVKNNMQVIVSLLNLQANYAGNEETVKFIQDCNARVKSMALVHERLYHSETLASIDLPDYISTLCDNLHSSYSRGNTSLQLDVEDMDINMDVSVPLGLLLNELVTNAFKHAFPGNMPGTVKVAVRHGGANRLEFSVSDNGVGMPEGMNASEKGSLGMLLVRALVRQLGGTLEMFSDGGSTVRIGFDIVQEGQ
jgi:PAS domain S-box-containing protein